MTQGGHNFKAPSLRADATPGARLPRRRGGRLPRRNLPLRESGRKLYLELADALTRSGIDFNPALDWPALMITAVLWDTVREALETLQAEGAIQPDRAHGGDPRLHPAWRMGRDAMAGYKTWCAEFGLSPLARLRMGTPAEDGDPRSLAEILFAEVSRKTGE